MPVQTLLEKGSVGTDVKELQARLAALGFSPGPIDGDFGPQTEQAVMSFQQSRGLAVDGVAGPQTLAALGITGNGGGGSHQSLLVRLGYRAEEFGLAVGECNAPGAPSHWGPVGGHAPNSYHYSGRAFDASGPESRMQAFAAWVNENVAAEVVELIHNPNGSIKNGQHVGADFWGSDTWRNHLDHVHLAV